MERVSVLPSRDDAFRAATLRERLLPVARELIQKR
jgi:hypothetical protein